MVAFKFGVMRVVCQGRAVRSAIVGDHGPTTTNARRCRPLTPLQWPAFHTTPLLPSSEYAVTHDGGSQYASSHHSMWSSRRARAIESDQMAPGRRRERRVKRVPSGGGRVTQTRATAVPASGRQVHRCCQWNRNLNATRAASSTTARAQEQRRHTPLPPPRA